MINKNLINKLNSATKYPSILTYHELGENDRLQDVIQVGFNKNESVICTEKIDGVNARIIYFYDGSYFIGSREDLLTYSSDIIYNPSIGIVDTIREKFIPNLLNTKLENFVWVFYGEIYGGKIGRNGKNYTSSGLTGFRLFDISYFNSSYDLINFLENTSIEKISSWRDHGGQSFLNETPLQGIADQLNVPLVPRLPSAKPLPIDLAETLSWLTDMLPGKTNAALDGNGGMPEGVVIRNSDRSKIAKIRFGDYRRYFNSRY